MQNMNEKWKLKWTSLLIGEGISIFTSSLLQMAFVWYLTEKTGSAAILSLTTLIAFLPQAVLGMFIGVYVDRWKRKLVMIFSDLAIALIALLVFIYSLGSDIPTLLIMLVMFFRGIGGAFHQTSFSAITPLVVPPENLAKAGGANQGIVSISTLVSPAVAALVYSNFGISGAILMDVAGALIASIIVVFIKIPELKGEREIPSFINEFKAGYNILKAEKGLLWLAYAIGFFSLCFMPVSALYPLMSLDYFGGTTFEASIAETAFSVGMLLGSGLLSLWGGFKRKTRTMTVGMFLVALSLCSIIFMTPSMFYVFAVVCVFIGFSAPFFNVPFYALFQTKVQPEYLGRVFGIVNFIGNIGTPIGLLLSAAFADRIGVNNFCVISGLLLLGEGIWFASSKTLHSLDNQ